jgi:superfamily II DNA or RNA helicase
MMDEIKWRVPAKPDGMNYAQHRAVLVRHDPANPPCENWQEGLCNNLDGPCQPADQEGCRQLNFAHSHAKTLGGTYDAHNIRLECAVTNHAHGPAPEGRFADASPFDEPFDYSKLRYSQGAFLHAADEAARLWCDLRERTRDVILLCAAVTGAGKLIGMIAMLHRIAFIAAAQGPLIRPKHVLWLVPERSLATALAAEAERELVDYGMRASALRVFDAGEGSFDLGRPPEAPGIVFGCVQYLWRWGDDSGPRDQATVAAILANYDTIIWDECDYAEDQIQGIVTLAPHALKFGLTASPITGSGRFLKRFVVGPVIGYALVHYEDGALKIVEAADQTALSPSMEVMRAHSHREAMGEAEVTEAGESNDADSITAVMVTLRRAIQLADDLEDQMRRVRPADYFSPHLIVRCQSIKQAEEIFLQINEALRGMPLHGLGWRAALMHGQLVTYPSRRGRSQVPENERRLGAVDADGRPRHPWFAAKNNEGQATEQSVRILVVVDMGIRGLNNWPCSFAVDLTGGQSQVNDVQYLGRALRWPGSRAAWLEEAELRAFARVHLSVPFNRSHTAVRWYEAAIDFVLNLETKMAKSGLATWQDLVRIAPTSTEWQKIEPDDPFTVWDELELDHALGEWAERTERAPETATDEELTALVEAIRPTMDGRRKLSALEYITAGARDEDERRQRWVRPPLLEPLVVVRREHPREPDDYTDEEMVRSLIESEQYSRWDAEQDWAATPDRIKFRLKRQRAEDDRRLFVAPLRLRRLHRSGEGEGLITTMADEQYREAVRRALVQNSSEVQRSFHAAMALGVRRAFGLTEADNNSRMNEPEYHFKLMSPGGGNRVREETRWQLVEWGVIRLGRAYGR